MLPLDPDLVSRYQQTLAEASIPVHIQPHYRKWLRFYLDFCSKYDFPPLERDSVRGFLRKLADKKQAQWMRQQATDAVRLFFVLYGAARDGQDVAARERVGSVATSAAKQAELADDKRTAQEGNKALEAATDSGSAARQHEGPDQGCGHRLLGRTADPKGRAVSVGSAVPTAGSAENFGQDIDQGQHEESAEIGSRTPAVPRAPGSWKALHDGLADAIRVRHYSKKTLRTYSGWARKLQGFTRNRHPAELSVGEKQGKRGQAQFNQIKPGGRKPM